MSLVNYSSRMANSEDATSTADIRAVARVGQICSLFGPGVVELSAADIADATGLNRTTAYRYCASMAAAGILERGVRRGTPARFSGKLSSWPHGLTRFAPRQPPPHHAPTKEATP